uniref:Integrase core domain containing protein n=1 Tax=Solanum tuberosum TaxID=4113 RepID=M1DMX2_SOLTU
MRKAWILLSKRNKSKLKERRNEDLRIAEPHSASRQKFCFEYLIVTTEHISANGANSCQEGHPVGGSLHLDDIDDVNSVYNPAHMGEMGEICMPQADGNAMFEDDHEEDHIHISESSKSKGSASSPRINDLLSRILDKVEGSDDLLKGMKDDFSSLNNKMNSHADVIKMLECQLSLLSAQLTSKTLIEDIARELDVVTRSGKVAIGNVMQDKDHQKHEESQGMEEQELPIRQNLAKEPQEEAGQQA